MFFDLESKTAWYMLPLITVIVQDLGCTLLGCPAPEARSIDRVGLCGMGAEVSRWQPKFRFPSGLEDGQSPGRINETARVFHVVREGLSQHCWF